MHAYKYTYTNKYIKPRIPTFIKHINTQLNSTTLAALLQYLSISNIAKKVKKKNIYKKVMKWSL